MSNKPRPFQKTQQQPSMADFARGVSSGALAPRDRFNRPLAKHQLVLYHPEVDVVYQITDVIPVMDPRIPGMVRLMLTAIVPLATRAGQPTAPLVIVGEADHTAQVAGNGQPTVTGDRPIDTPQSVGGDDAVADDPMPDPTDTDITEAVTAHIEHLEHAPESDDDPDKKQ